MAHSIALRDKFHPSEGKLVRLAGLEPAKRVFSSLLIIAFLCAILLTFIHGFPSYVNGYFAPRGRHGQKKLCGIVRLCGKCAVVGGGLNLCGNCAGALAIGFAS